MTVSARHTNRGNLASQLRWFIGLRWIAAAAVLLGGVLDWQGLLWYSQSAHFLEVGAILLFYNVWLWRMLRRPLRGNSLAALAWMQLLFDMGCLSLLVIWTGGARSPLVGFFVFHMVFASMLLRRRTAYAAASAAIIMLCAGLELSGQWPHERDDILIFAGALLTLLLTVFLANRITMGMRRQRRRLVRQNRRIAAMTQQLRRHQQTLVQHEKMVALGQMAAGVAHEIANPLASMDSLLQLIQRFPERQRPDSIATLRQQVERIHQIIRQMKTFAHPAEMQRQNLSLNDVVEEAIGMVRFDSRVKQVQIDRHFSPQTGSLALLPQAIQQVLVNLIINALDAMADTPEPRLTVRTERRDGWCVIDVTDNGPGIRTEHMARLFEPFFTTKPVGKGTGLGLSISYSLMQKQGGSISVRSQPGKATTFTLRLPTSEESSQNRESPKPDIVISENPPA